MKKLRFAAAFLGALMLIAFPLTGSNAATRALTVKTNYPFVVTEAGKSVRFNLEVLTPEPRPVGLSIPTLPANWQATIRGGGFVIGSVFGAPTNPPPVELEVKVPPETAPGDYEVVVAGDAAGTVDRLVVTLRVSDQAAGAVSLKSEFPAQRGQSSDTFTFNVTLENNTPEKTAFTMDATGPRGWQVNAIPSAENRAATLSVDGGASGDIQVTADPPDNVTAGEYPIKLAVSGPGGRTATIDLSAEITGNVDFELSTADQRLNREVRAGAMKEITLVINNNGTAALQNIQLTTTPPTGWQAKIVPETLDAVAPKSTGRATLELTPASDAVAGDYSMSVTATNVGGGSQNMDIRLTVKTSRLWGAFGLILIVAVLLGLRSVFRRYGRR